MNQHSRMRLLCIVIALFVIGIDMASRAESDSVPPIATRTGNFDLPPFAKEMLNKAGLTTEDLKNDPELRRKWLERFQGLRGVPAGSKRKKGARTRQRPSQTNFYKVIVDNNLFRPLGYRPPKRGPAFQLIATLIDRETDESKALIQNNTNRQIHYVRVGEEFAGAKVEKIESFKVTLFHNGKSQELNIPRGGLIGKGGGGGPSRPQMNQPSPNPRENNAKARSERTKSSKDKSAKKSEKEKRKLTEEEISKLKEEATRRARQGGGRRVIIRR